MSRKDYDDIPYGFTMPPSEPLSETGLDDFPPERDSLLKPLTKTETETEEDSPVTEIAGTLDREGKRVQMVVGWMVGVSGVCRGQDFRLHSGKNNVGRDSKFEVPLMDRRITRAAILQVAYDPFGNIFLISPGSGNCLAYVNGEYIIETKRLQPYDRIQIGYEDDGTTEFICELVFVPLCCDHFSWARKRDTD